MLAVQTALLRGVDVVIFTRDLDLEEQFMKLMAFLQHDYNSMAVAEHHAANPEAFDFRRVDVPPHDEYADGDHLLVCEVPLSEVEALRPGDSSPLHFHTVVVGDCGASLRVTPLSFCAERGLRRLLEIKSRTDGLNTDRLGGRNCRLRSVRGTAFVAPTILKDRMVPLGSTQVAALDKRFATFVKEAVAAADRLG